MPIVLYQVPASAPCRSVMMVAQHLGIKLEHKLVNLWTGEHMKPEFLAINPLHTLPTIDDNGFILWDSHAIITYLANKYAPDNAIYPKDPQQRAVVDRLLYYDIGTLNKTQLEYLVPQLFQGQPPNPEKAEALKKALEVLEKFLEKTPYVAGNHLTLADFAIVATLSFLEAAGDYSFAPYPKITTYLKKMKAEIPNYKEMNDAPLKDFKELLKTGKK